MCWLDSHGPDIHEWITCIIKCIDLKNRNIKRKISQVAGAKKRISKSWLLALCFMEHLTNFKWEGNHICNLQCTIELQCKILIFIRI